MAVYAKRPFGAPEQVLKYLARYTHRIAISNRRLISMAESRVTFEWNGYADGSQTMTITLEAVEFINSFTVSCSTCCPPALFTSASEIRTPPTQSLANRSRQVAGSVSKAAPAQSLSTKSVRQPKGGPPAAAGTAPSRREGARPDHQEVESLDSGMRRRVRPAESRIWPDGLLRAADGDRARSHGGG
jgi:Putative transposase